MGETDIFGFNFLTFWTGSGRGRPPGNVQVELPDLPLKYEPDTTSRSEVIEFTVNDYFGAIHRLFSHLLLFLAIEENATARAKPNGTLLK